jgi:hypothetical protein
LGALLGSTPVRTRGEGISSITPKTYEKQDHGFKKHSDFHFDFRFVVFRLGILASSIGY